MIVDTTQSKTEHEMNSNVFLYLLEAVGDQPDLLEPLIVARRFRDCIYLTRAERKYILAAGGER